MVIWFLYLSYMHVKIDPLLGSNGNYNKLGCYVLWGYVSGLVFLMNNNTNNNWR